MFACTLQKQVSVLSDSNMNTYICAVHWLNYNN